MSSSARVTVTEELRIPILYGATIPPALNLTVEWDSGQEDRALVALQQAYESAVTKINASRPAASTPKEGTTP